MDIDAIVKGHARLMGHLPMLEELKKVFEGYHAGEDPAETVSADATVSPELEAFLKDAQAVLAEVREAVGGLEGAKAEFAQMSAELADGLARLRDVPAATSSDGAVVEPVGKGDKDSIDEAGTEVAEDKTTAQDPASA